MNRRKFIVTAFSLVVVPRTPEALNQAADFFVSSILSMTEEQKNGWMHTAKKVNPCIHALVKAKLNEIREKVRG